ncbi:phd finger protein [Culex quinquefasciatus]|uniref:Phd finger protein n=1 Tax=Culex quinquefasciatus TaxID=7176 RepID=B0X4W5_CULQU|nr:phd finger protein [Culex quinquefasciatus]|eukprot:XP_001864687.1 phd finger protein [Culex quinquefasciatus]
MISASINGTGYAEELQKAVDAHNATYHSVTKLPPEEVFSGRKIRRRLPLVEFEKVDIDEDLLDERDRTAKLQGKAREDRRRSARECRVKPGDTVIVERQTRSKGDPRFAATKYTVIQEQNGNLTLNDGEGREVKRHVSQTRKVAEWRKSDSNQAGDSAGTDHAGPSNAAPRKTRERKAPAYLKDYALLVQASSQTGSPKPATTESRMKRKASAGVDLTTQTLLDFDLGESSSDSDFRIEDHDDDSDDCSAGSKEDDDDGGGGGGGGGSDDDDDDDDDGDSGSSDGSDEGDEDEGSEDSGTTGSGSKGKEKEGEKVVEVVKKVVSLEEALKKSVKGMDKATLKLLSASICCACLGDRSDDQNEIVECDGCGVTVHEGCYGVSESTSVSSTVSSCSTEPWFCEACKAGVSDPDCELCPNKGGIFKETDVGKWVHLVCALYVPGVAFGEVDQLSSVTLFEMPYNKWGAKTCSLCDDAKYARTGVCIGCDAGMCKTYFHVTCAQYAGLLSEAHSEEADQADPFYAHCKIHSDKTLIKHRKRNYNAIRLKGIQRKMEQEAKRLEKPSPEQVRIERKLAKHRKKYVHHKETKNPPWVPTQKMPRLITTSATACKKLLLKAELMGIDTAAMEFQEAQMTALADVRKKWHIPPAFSVEFIGYYLDRTVRLKEIKKNLQQQVTSNQQLLDEQQRLRDKYDSTMKINQEALSQNDDLKDAIRKLYDDIHALCPNKALIPIEQIGKPPSVPPMVANPSVVINTPSSTPPARTITVPTAAALKMGVGFPLQNLIAPGKRDDTGRILSTQCKQNSEELLNECGICKRCSDQHLLAKCDTCHLYYHLGCLNPPLTRHPKKSKLYGWQCSECDKSDDSGPEHVILPKAPRKSRTRYSKDGIIVPYDMPSPEFEKSPESTPVGSVAPTSQAKRPRKSGTGDSPSKVAVANGIETKDLLLEIPKIDQELAEKLSAGETSVEMLTPKASAPPVKRGRKKKVTEPTSPDKEVPKQEDVKPKVEVIEIPDSPVKKPEQPKEEPAPEVVEPPAKPKEVKPEKKKKEKLKAPAEPAPTEPEPLASASSQETLTSAESAITLTTTSSESLEQAPSAATKATTEPAPDGVEVPPAVDAATAGTSGTGGFSSSSSPRNHGPKLAKARGYPLERQQVSNPKPPVRKSDKRPRRNLTTDFMPLLGLVPENRSMQEAAKKTLAIAPKKL